MGAPRPNAETLPVLLGVDEVAAHLNITVRHLRRLVFERRIPFLKVGNLIRFDPDELATWLKEREVRPRPGRSWIPPAVARSACPQAQ